MSVSQGGYIMSKNSISNNENLAKKIKLRRQELNLTIEEAASKAGIGTKTWSRYESGNPIRQDKLNGLLKALKWMDLPDELDTTIYYSSNNYDYKKHNSWSETIKDYYGELAAISFCIGSDILSDYIKDDLESLSHLSKDSHIGEIDFSYLKDLLPQRYLTRYNYEFIYELNLSLVNLIEKAKSDIYFVANKPIEEILLILIADEAELLMEDYIKNTTTDNNYDNTWVYDIFDDMDAYTFLYSDILSPEATDYDFKNWFNEAFFTNN